MHLIKSFHVLYANPLSHRTKDKQVVEPGLIQVTACDLF